MVPDYGLEAPDDEQYGEGFNDETQFGTEDTFNDDTFGETGEWQQGNEAALEMSRLHEAFLSGELEMPPSDKPAEYIPDSSMAEPGFFGGAAAGGAGFFGDLNVGGGDDFLLEDEAAMDAFDMLPNLDDDAPLSLDAHTESLLGSPSKKASTPPAASGRGAAAASNRGLRVSGLPRTLDEAQTKQLLTHFGPLAHFQLQRGGTSNVALLSYQDPSVTDSACESLNGIPLGARCARPPAIPSHPSIRAPGRAP